MLLKLKDWPPSTDIAEYMPLRFKNLFDCFTLPGKEFLWLGCFSYMIIQQIAISSSYWFINLLLPQFPVSSIRILIKLCSSIYWFINLLFYHPRLNQLTASVICCFMNLPIHQLCFIRLLINQLVVWSAWTSSSYLFINLLFHQVTNSLTLFHQVTDSSTLLFQVTNSSTLLFHQVTNLSTLIHQLWFINFMFHQFANKCNLLFHFTKVVFRQLAVSLNWHFIMMPFYQLDVFIK